MPQIGIDLTEEFNKFMNKKKKPVVKIADLDAEDIRRNAEKRKLALELKKMVDDAQERLTAAHKELWANLTLKYKLFSDGNHHIHNGALYKYAAQEVEHPDKDEADKDFEDED